MKTILPLYLIAIAVSVIALQNAGIIRPVKIPTVKTDGLVWVRGSVDVGNQVDVNVSNEVEANLIWPVNVNLESVAGCNLVTSQQGMSIGVSSKQNTVIPIHWGDVSISK